MLVTRWAQHLRQERRPGAVVTGTVPAATASWTERRNDETGLGIEQVDLVQGDLERQGITGPDTMLAADERDDVVSADAQVDELLVAEVLDHIGVAAQRTARAGRDDIEMLGADAHDRLSPLTLSP